MYTAKIETNGEILTLSQNEPKWQIISITGLDQPPAQVNLTSVAGLDGSKFNSAKLDTRNLVITLKLNGEVEKNRLELYRFFRTKELCTFYYKTESLDVYIKGYVETVECVLFSEAETMQISIICPYPYFSSINQVIASISNLVAGFTFPFSIEYDTPIAFSTYVIHSVTDVYNASGAETGLTIEVDILDNSVEDVKIQNTVSGEFIEVNYDFSAGDKLIITTIKGQKGIHLIRNGAESNIFGALQQGSTFIQLGVGDNYFGYSVDNGARDDKVYITFKYYNLYRGV